jgi:hypothetical protein
VGQHGGESLVSLGRNCCCTLHAVVVVRTKIDLLLSCNLLHPCVHVVFKHTGPTTVDCTPIHFLQRLIWSGYGPYVIRAACTCNSVCSCNNGSLCLFSLRISKQKSSWKLKG